MIDTWEKCVVGKNQRKVVHIDRLSGEGPHSSVGKESTCDAGDPSLIPRLGRSTGEGIGYPLQHSWAFLVAQLVKNLPAMWETWVGSLGWEDSLEKEKATHSGILAWRIPWTKSIGSQRVGHNWVWVGHTLHFTALPWRYKGEGGKAKLSRSHAQPGARLQRCALIMMFSC